jgi:hypothetical protein
MKRQLKLMAALAFLAVLVGVIVFFFSTNDGTIIKIQQFAPHYLTFQGSPTKIYFLSATTCYAQANETYATSEGLIVQKGSPLFTISVTLRNDYNSDNAPPPNEMPISPADGTAYVYLNAVLFDRNGNINATNVSKSDFSIPNLSGSGLVLASGQTAMANIWMMTNRTDLDRFDLNLVLLAASIPT